jgi:hypothetical protein
MRIQGFKGSRIQVKRGLWLNLPKEKGGPVYPDNICRMIWEKNNPGIYRVFICNLWFKYT